MAEGEPHGCMGLESVAPLHSNLLAEISEASMQCSETPFEFLAAWLRGRIRARVDKTAAVLYGRIRARVDETAAALYELLSATRMIAQVGLGLGLGLGLGVGVGVDRVWLG